MDKSWDRMIEVARTRGLRTLVWAMEHGVYDEKCLETRASIRHRIANAR